MVEIGIVLLIAILTLWYIKIGYKNHIESMNIRKSKIVYKDLSILVYCHNDGVFLKKILKNLKEFKYPNLDIIFINDGSTDHTMSKLNYLLNLEAIEYENKEDFCTSKVKGIYKSSIYSNFYVIDKERGGKTESLRAGTALSKGEFVVTIEANASLKRDALFLINMNLQNDDVIAVGGAVMIEQGVSMNSDCGLFLKGKSKLIEYAQALEYIATFYIIRNSLIKLNSVCVISGDFGAFKKSVIEELGLFQSKHIGSIEMSVQLNEYASKNGKIITYDDRAVCFTEAPSNLKDCYKKRMTWQDCFIEIFFKHYNFLLGKKVKNYIGFIGFINTLLLGYLSVILTYIGVISIVVSFSEGSQVSINAIIQIVIGIVIFIVYSLGNLSFAKNNKLCFGKISKIKLITIHIYMLVWFKPMTIVIFLMGFTMYFFKRLYKYTILRQPKVHTVKLK